ncbi:MAG: hypothetical protein GY740_21835 [Gammaproteobacteria bacterium]|nr:hypothetical protein [Gammaproteobacteria bacterium]
MRCDEGSFAVSLLVPASAESIPKPADRPAVSIDLARPDYLLRHYWRACV